MNSPVKSTGLTLLLNRVIRAPRPRVFQAFSSVDELKKWFGPGDCHVIEGELQLRAGGAYRVTMQTSTQGQVELAGEYSEVVTNERLCFTWSWSKPPELAAWGNMTVTIEFADHREGTLVTIKHDGLLNEEVRSDHNEGWGGSLDKLASCCAAT